MCVFASNTLRIFNYTVFALGLHKCMQKLLALYSSLDGVTYAWKQSVCVCVCVLSLIHI